MTSSSEGKNMFDRLPIDIFCCLTDVNQQHLFYAFYIIFIIFSKKFFLYSCYFDGMKGKITNICFTSLPLLIILLMIIVLYILTWQRIYAQSERLKDVLGKKDCPKITPGCSYNVTICHCFLRSLFVTKFSNVGGIVNGIVYIIIRKTKLTGLSGKCNESTLKTNEKNTNSTGQMLNQLSI
ncbi:hypothetical protein KUTeg_015043 [Tegillarca granosa]|uniref:Uncharacterized protein n=1 Tax=Tegillarca granosa TaxID=220873 RepID=A0ABQ9EPP2_TEGGR|nr:hypothetical protein KUTeg_015043 [Tegillarca granosa]